jgi:hypothetical protein
MTRSPLESAIDELYQLPLAGFTAARNALAKTLKGAAAKQIKQLAKPTVVPWTVNQLYWHARKAYDRVFATGQALREVQIAALKGRTTDVRRASDDHRAAVADAVREGIALAAKDGARPPADQLARMLEALSLAKTPADAPGRLTEVIQPSGFEALAGITPSGGTTSTPEPGAGKDDDQPSTRSGPRLVTSPPVVRREDPAEARRRAAEERRRAAEEQKQEQQRLKELAEARARAEARIHAAERELTQARENLGRAERAVEEARRAVEEAEHTLATARDDRVLSSPHV